MDIEQGNIIFGLVSKKYPEQPCFGIVITASCDIANRKVDEVYYLTAIDVQEWLCSKIGHSFLIKEKQNDLYNKIRKQVNDQQLNETLLANFSLDEVKTVINKAVSENKTRKEILKNIDEYIELGLNESAEKRKNDAKRFLRESTELLLKIGRGDYYRFLYLPDQEYLLSTKKDHGLIVDFQEINSLSIEHLFEVVNEKVDYSLLKEKEEHLRCLRETFWLKNAGDFALLSGKIQSPCREHLLQRFASYFTRIGLDGAQKKDYKNISEGIK